MFFNKEDNTIFANSKPEIIDGFQKDNLSEVELTNSEIEQILFCMSIAFHEELGDENIMSDVFKKFKIHSPKVSFYYDFLEKEKN